MVHTRPHSWDMSPLSLESKAMLSTLVPLPHPPGPGLQGGKLIGTRVQKSRTQGPSPPMLGLLFRVKFLVMSDRGPVAETEWSSDTHLQQGMGTDEQITH